MNSETGMVRERLSKLYLGMFLLACFDILHTTLALESRYVDLKKWTAGTEKLPFQRRALLVPLLRWASSNRVILYVANHMRYHKEPMGVTISIVDFLSLLGCGYLVTRLYDETTDRGRLRWAPSALFIVFFAFTSVMRYEQRFVFPYDMLGMFLFTLGLYLVFHDRLWELVVLMPLATFNRESTVMWVPLVLMAAWYRAQRSGEPKKLWMRSALCSITLVVMWLAIQHYLKMLYIDNNASEDYPRYADNLVRLASPKKWDEILSPCGFVLPFLFVYRQRIGNELLRLFLLLIPLWVAIMVYQAVIIESRIFNELVPYCAVVSVLIFEATYLQPRTNAAMEQSSSAAEREEQWESRPVVS